MVHGDRYDYSQVVYINSVTKVCIICRIHGEFWQVPSRHLMGDNCPYCYGRTKKTIEEFIAKACSVHGDRYDYSLSDYKGSLTKVCIICPIHGEFWMTPNAHLSGQGCPKCNGTPRKNVEQFIAEARLIHGDKYDYSKVDYKNNFTKVCIICPIHGEFWQEPRTHLSGHGCPKCTDSIGESKVMDWLNAHNVEYRTQYHIELPFALFSRNHLRIDFYIPAHNVFIEYHGKQHYKFCPYFHKTEDKFAEQQDRDRRLREYCKQHKIRLIEIPYTEIDNIDKILSKKIKV